MIIVGLTGGIGSGKTTVGHLFVELGVPVYNSDIEAKRLMETSSEVKNAIKILLGDNAYTGNKLNKTYISSAVFNNKELLQRLNSIVHPAVREHFLTWAKQQNAPYVIQETALIFEIGSQDFYDRIILVTAPENIRIDRIMDRDGENSKKDVSARIKNQWDDARKLDTCDYIIENLDLGNTRDKVLEVHHALLDYS